MNNREIFSSFCRYVDSTIFSKENVGEMISFMVDQTFINEFCHKHEITERQLMSSVFSNLEIPFVTHMQAKGILAIQLFAATKRHKSEDITERNYRKRLSEVLNWDIQDLQTWMSSHQEKYWNTLYTWCESHGYYIAKCRPKEGTGKYVQYPIQQAKRIFTEEDLRYISYHFVEKNISPNEDICEKELWRILGSHKIDGYVHTNHGSQLIKDLEYRKDAYRQIYNYYLRWDGSYKDFNKQKDKQAQKERYFLYMSGDFSSIDVRDKSMKLIKMIPIHLLTQKVFENYYTFKRKGIVLFKQNDIYDNYWEETRYLEDGEEGMAIVFKNDLRYSFNQKYPLQEFNRNKPLYEFSGFDIFKIYNIRGYSELYTERRFYSLEGGLKVGRRQYLEGAPPILRLEKDSYFLIDGEEPPMKPHDGNLFLDFLSIGEHYIKFPNHKRLDFEIVTRGLGKPNWQVNYNKWNISRKDACWNSSETESGIVGLDFTSIKIKEIKSDNMNVITKWALIQQGIPTSKPQSNVILKILSNNNGNRIQSK